MWYYAMDKRPMDTTSTQRLKDIIGSNDKIAIAVGKNPTLDEMAGALALQLSLSSFGKSVTISCPTQPIVELSSLVGIDKVRNQLDAEGKDLIVSFPYRDGEIEKVSYTIENGLLNIVVKAGENGLVFNERDVLYRKAGDNPSVLIVVGTPTLSDLGHLFNVEALKDTTVVNIDNKTNNQEFGDVVLVSPQFSSVSEQVGQVLTSLNLPMDMDIAQNLLSGISFATDNFQKPNTSASAFEVAAVLMKKGAVRIQPQTGRSFAQPDPFFNPPPVQQQSQQVRMQKQQPFPKSQRRDPQRQQQQGGQQMHRPSLPTEEKDSHEAPPDWLAPKVYKGQNLI